MNMSGKKSITCIELIHELVLDPFYGVRRVRADTGETYVADPDSSEQFLTVKPDQNSEGGYRMDPAWEYDPSLTMIYEIDSEETKSILVSIYKDNPRKQVFGIKFRRLPCKKDLLLHMVYSWCGLLGLRYSRGGKVPENPEFDILDNWSKDFRIKLKHLRVFLRNNNWPLPVGIFDSEPDNTQNKVNLSDKEYEDFVPDQLVLATALKQRQLGQVTDSKITHSKTPPMTRREQRKRETRKRYLDWNAQAETIRKDHPRIKDSDIARRIYRHQKVKKYLWRTILRKMNLKNI